MSRTNCSRSVVPRRRRVAPATAPTLAAAIAVVAGLGGASAGAATNYYWDPNGSVSGGSSSGGTGVWDNGATPDWYPGTGSTDVVWPNTAAAVFNGSAGTVTLGSNVTAVGMTFTTSGYVLATGAYTLLDTGQLNFNSNVTITGTGGMLETTGATLIVTNAAGATLTVGAGGILDLAGPANSSQAPSYRNNATNTSLTLAGGTIIANGVIDIAHGANTGTINLNSGLLTTSYGFGTDSGSNVGSVNFGGATLAITQSLSDLIDPSVNTNFTASTGITVNDVAGGGGAVFNTGSYSLGVSEAIKHSDPGANGLVDGGIVKLGTGTLTLSGSSTFTGGVTVAQGTVTAAATASLGSATAPVGLSLAPASGASAAVNITAATQTIASLSSSGAGTSTLVLGNYNGSSAGTATTLTVGNTNVLATSSTTFAGVISNASTANGATGSLVKTGPGTLTLSASNSFTGGVSLASGSASGNNGVLVATTAGAFGTGTINTDPSGNTELGQVQLTGGFTLTNAISSASRTVATLLANPNFLNLSGNNVLSGNISVGGGGSGFALASNGGTLTASGTFANAARLLDLGGTSNGVFSGVISSTAVVEKDGAGAWTLSASNTYSGGTTINTGLLVATSTTGDSLGTGAVTVASGAQLQIQDHAGGVPSLPNAFTLSGSGTAGSGTAGGGALIFYNSSFNNPTTGLTGTTTLAADTTVRIDPAVQGTSLIDFRGVIGGAGGLTLFTQNTTTHATDYKFDAANTYGTGGTASNLTTLLSSSATSAPLQVELATVANPLPVTTTLTFGGTPAGAPAGTFNKAVTLELDGISQTVAGLAVGIAPATAGGYSIVGNSATPSLLTVNNAVANTFGGVIGGAAANNNNVGLAMTGTGTLGLTGTNTFAGGTTITAGTLQANNAVSSLGSGAATVGTATGAPGTGGTLAGGTKLASGATGGPVTVNATGTITAGSGGTPGDSVGTLGMTTLNAAGGQYAVKLDGSNASPGAAMSGTAGANASDELVLSALTTNGAGSLTVNPVLISATAGQFAPQTTYSFVIADATGSANAAAFDGLINQGAASAIVVSNASAAGTFALSTMSDGNSGEDLLLDFTTAAAPEPTSLLLAAAAAGPLALGRRRAGRRTARVQ